VIRATLLWKKSTGKLGLAGFAFPVGLGGTADGHFKELGRAKNDQDDDGESSGCELKSKANGASHSSCRQNGSCRSDTLHAATSIGKNQTGAKKTNTSNDRVHGSGWISVLGVDIHDVAHRNYYRRYGADKCHSPRSRGFACAIALPTNYGTKNCGDCAIKDNGELLPMIYYVEIKSRLVKIYHGLLYLGRL
jgi:hypothetical protein